MGEIFRLEVAADGLATLAFDTPGKTANVFERPAIAELETLVADLGRRTDIGCLLLTSAKPRIFIAGADIEEIARVRLAADAEAGARKGQAIFNAWESLPFPTVAAIRGAAVGGGCEIALASTWIVISDREDVRIGLPEVKLGIVPGWGGSTRLPRRVGLRAALDIILQGKTIPGRTAWRIGLADALVPDAGFETLAAAFARARIGAPRRNPAKERKGPGRAGLAHLVLERNPAGRRLLFAQARKRTLAATKGHYPAPLRALEVVRAGYERGLEAGFDAEAAAIGELAISPVSKNLVHVFRLMEANKKEAPRAGGEAPPVRRAAVLGAGVMGGGIARLLVDEAGVPVRLRDIAPRALAAGMAHAASLLERKVSRRRITVPEMRRRMALLQPTLALDGLERVDFVLEAVVEDLGVKQRLFAELAERVGPDAVLASNTSSLSIDRIAADAPHPERVVGMHFFNPVNRMPLVEVIAGARTAPAVADAVVALARRLGKTPVLVRDGPGFLVNRLLAFYMGEALALLAEGAPIEAIDRAMLDWGMPMGPIALVDEVGIDVAAKVSGILKPAFGDRLPAVAGQERVLASGRLGAKNGRGFYRYDGARRGAPDPEIHALLGIAPSPGALTPSAMVDRMVLPMVNEAARCLAEGVVAGPSHLDLAMIMGTGFPPFRGGLCRWADEEGVFGVVNRLKQLESRTGPRFAPSAALLEIAHADGFYRWHESRRAT